MATLTGKRYVAPGGVELIVTKGGDGILSDGEVPLTVKGSDDSLSAGVTQSESPELSLGKRYQSTDGEVMVLITKGGQCDLRYKGVCMEIQEPRPLPSSD